MKIYGDERFMVMNLRIYGYENFSRPGLLVLPLKIVKLFA